MEKIAKDAPLKYVQQSHDRSNINSTMLSSNNNCNVTNETNNDFSEIMKNSEYLPYMNDSRSS